MATVSSAALCAAIALLAWTAVGWLVVRRLPLPRALALSLAPTVGWAVQNVVVLDMALVAGFSALTIAAATAAIGVVALAVARPASHQPRDSAAMPAWIYAAAAVVALVPAAAIVSLVVGLNLLADGLRSAERRG